MLLLTLRLLEKPVEREHDLLLDALRSKTGISLLGEPAGCRLHAVERARHEVLERCLVERPLEPFSLLALGCILGAAVASSGRNTEKVVKRLRRGRLGSGRRRFTCRHRSRSGLARGRRGRLLRGTGSG